MTRRLAAGLWGTAALLTLAAIGLGAGIEAASDVVPFSLLTMAIATSGLVVVWRLPQQRVGWLFCVLGVWYGIGELAQGYGARATEEGWPAGDLGTWLVSWTWIVDLTGWVLIILLFPDGRLPERRWRGVVWAAGLGCALAVPGYALSSSENAAFESGENPLLVESPVVGIAFGIGFALVIAALAAAVISLALRLHRARGVERQQLKCFAYAAVSLLVAAPFAIALRNETILAQLLIILVLFSLPTSAAVAMLRYRLYDIDVVINRTLVYAALTATLAATYLGSVLALQFVLSGVTANSSLAVAASTLAVAALFRPARRRIQSVVDRRFYRSRYDGAQTLERFGARLRDEVDLDALAGDLRSVVAETMAPAHVSLWMRPR